MNLDSHDNLQAMIRNSTLMVHRSPDEFKPQSLMFLKMTNGGDMSDLDNFFDSTFEPLMDLRKNLLIANKDNDFVKQKIKR